MSRNSEYIDYQPQYERTPWRLTRFGAFVVGLTAGVSIVAGVIGGANVIQAQRPGPIAHTYESTINPGGTPEGTLANLEADNGLDFNQTALAQEASYRQSDEQGYPYMAHPGDITRIFTDENNKVVSVDIYTVDEQKNDRDSEK